MPPGPSCSGPPPWGQPGSAGAARVAHGTGSPALPPAPLHVSLDQHELSCAASCAQPFPGVLGQGKPSTQALETAGQRRAQGNAWLQHGLRGDFGQLLPSLFCQRLGAVALSLMHVRWEPRPMAAKRHPQSGEPQGDTARGSPWGGFRKKTLGNCCTDNRLQAGLQTPGWAPCSPKTAQLVESSRKIWERGQWETRTCTAGTQSWTTFAEAEAGTSRAAPRPARRRRGCCTELSGVGITRLSARWGTHQASRSAGRVCAITESRFLAGNNSVYQSAEGRKT